MVAAPVFSSWLVAKAKEALSGTFYVMLLNDSGSLTVDSTAAEIVSKEVIGNGYSRQPFTFDTANIAYNSSTEVAELPDSATVEFTASGGAIAYDAIVVWQNNDVVAALTVSSINTSNNRLTITSHGLSDTDKVAVTATVSNPGGILTDTIYYVNSVDTNTIELYEDEALTSIVDITNTGSGTIYVRTANGEPAIPYFITPISINDGQTKTIAVPRWDHARG